MAATTAPPKDPQLAGWIDQIEAISNETRVLISGLSTTQLTWRPAPTKWSIVECLDHLVSTSTKGAAYWQSAIDRGRARNATGAGPFSFGWLGSWFVKQMQPNPKKGMLAPSLFSPGSGLDPGKVAAEFWAAQTLVQRVFAAADGLDLSRIKARSAVTPLFRMNLAAWFAGTVAHERRHLEQMRRVRSHAGFPA